MARKRRRFTAGRAGRRTHHRLVVRLLQRGATPFVPRRADAGRGLPQRQRDGVNGGSLRLPGRALVSPRGRGATRDPPIPGASRRRRPSLAPRPGSPPGHRGPCWKLSFPCRWRTHGWSTHPKTTHGEGSRGLSQPLGIHLTFALGLSNAVRPPQSLTQWAGYDPGGRFVGFVEFPVEYHLMAASGGMLWTVDREIRWTFQALPGGRMSPAKRWGGDKMGGQDV